MNTHTNVKEIYMVSKEVVLKLLKEQGEKGITTKQIANIFRFKKIGSTSKIIWYLKKDGFNINYDTEKKAYVLENSDKVIKQMPTKNALQVITKNDSQTTSENEQQKDFSIYTPTTHKNDKSKKELVLQCLTAFEANGVSALEIAKHTGIMLKNICFHIYSLRRYNNYKILFKEGRYYLSSKSDHIKNISKHLLAPTEEAPNLFEALNDKRLVQGIEKINAEDRASYIDLLKKIIYYRKCALGMLDTTQLLEDMNLGKI